MLKNLSPYIMPYRKWIALCILLTAGEVGCEIALPYLMSRIVDVGIAGENLRYIFTIGISMIVTAAVAILFGVLNARYSAGASQGFAAGLREGLFGKIQGFSFSNIDSFSGASLITRMTNDVNNMQMSIMMSLRMLTRAPIMLVSALIVAMTINFRLSLIIFVSIFLLVIGTTLIMRLAGKLFSEVQTRLDALNGTVQENLIAIRVVKAFVREAHEKLKFKKVNDALMEAGLKAGNLIAIAMPMMMLVLNGTTIAVIWIGGTFVGSGTMTTGELMSFISYIMQILMSVMIFAMVFVMLTRARASARRISEVLETEADVVDTVSESGPKVKTGKIEFQNVCFSYGKDKDNKEEEILTDISFTAEPGEFVAIIGGTGSGKSSLVNLIPRFYDVTAGRILVDGVDVRDYRQEDLRDGVGVVLQKNNLFSGTIKENLLWGNKNADMAEIIKAAGSAQAHDFIESFADGYDTELGQGGVNVSGGQKQRLCIARAMLKRSPILILDDSTSAVDTSTEAKIREAFRSELRDCTILLVAQRISSVQDADKILVLDDGKIAGIGTHEELLATNSIYQETCQSQMEGGAA